MRPKCRRGPVRFVWQKADPTAPHSRGWIVSKMPSWPTAVSSPSQVEWNTSWQCPRIASSHFMEKVSLTLFCIGFVASLFDLWVTHSSVAGPPKRGIEPGVQGHTRPNALGLAKQLAQHHGWHAPSARGPAVRWCMHSHHAQHGHCVGGHADANRGNTDLDER